MVCGQQEPLLRLLKQVQAGIKKIVMLTGALGLLLACNQLPVKGDDPTPGYNTPIPPEIMTPDSVERKYLGTLEYSDGRP